MEEKSNGKLVFLDTLLKRNNAKISGLVHRKPTHTDQCLHYSSHQQTSCKEIVVSVFNRTYSIITTKDDLTKENARIKQVLKENGCQENIIGKIFKRITSRVATEDKNNTIYEIDCSNCEAVYFGESKLSLKSCSDEHKRCQELRL